MSNAGPARVFTVGHSTRALDEFTALLKREGVTHRRMCAPFPDYADSMETVVFEDALDEMVQAGEAAGRNHPH